MIREMKFLFQRRVYPLRSSFNMRKGMMKFFDLHEYEGKILLSKNKLPVENCRIANSVEEAVKNAESMNSKVVVKCQVHAGGRGKGRLTSGLQGGVQMCNSLEEVKNYSSQMIGHSLITKQTTSEGLPVKSVLVSQVVDVKKQLYLAILLDRKYGGPVILASNEGGVDIEEVAKKSPELIIIEPICVQTGVTNENLNSIVQKLNLTAEQKEQARNQLKSLYEMFMKYDATQIEINPWAVDGSGKVY